jgi:predicted outer membrane lipoprotein
LYYTTFASNLDHTESFAKTLVLKIKDSSQRLTLNEFTKRNRQTIDVPQSSFIKRVNNLIRQNLINLVDNCLNKNINCIKEWANVVEKFTDDGDVTFHATFEGIPDSEYQVYEYVIKELSDMNKSWNLLGILCGGISGVINALEYDSTEEEDDENTLEKM